LIGRRFLEKRPTESEVARTNSRKLLPEKADQWGKEKLKEGLS